MRKLAWLSSLCLLGMLLGPRAGAAEPRVSHVQRSGTIVPLYTYPTDASWAALMAAKMNHPRVAIIAVINPDSGPGAKLDPAYRTGIAHLQQAGIEVVGYVSTGLAAKRPEAAIRQDIDCYRAWYPSLTGLFLDEMSNPDGQAPPEFYSRLSEYARQQGFDYTIGNAGVGIDISYVPTVDTILIYEDRGLPDMAALSGWYGLYPATHFGILVYGVPFDTELLDHASPHIGYIYLTDRSGSNPWNALPSYLETLMQALDHSPAATQKTEN